MPRGGQHLQFDPAGQQVVQRLLADEPEQVPDAVVVTITDAEKLLGVSKVTIYRWLRDGFIIGEQITPGAPWQIRIDQNLRDKIQPAVPDGWLSLDDTAHALGVARQTVLHKVQRGQLEAIYVNRGRRKDSASRSNPTRLDCSTHPDERNAQC